MELSFRKIVNKEKDLAGKWRVWIEVADGELVMLKFQENPTITKVKDEVQKYIENRKLEEKNAITNPK